MKLVQKAGLIYHSTRLRALSWVYPSLAAQSALKLFSTPMRRAGIIGDALRETAEILKLNVQGIALTGYRWNKGGKQTVLIVHGFESGTGNFATYIERLVKRNFAVIAFDAQAHGASAGETILLTDYIVTLRLVIDNFGPIDHYIAHSFGCLALMHSLETVEYTPDNRVALIAGATETTTAIDGFFKLLSLNDRLRKNFDALIYLRTQKSPEYFSIRRAMHQVKGTIRWYHDETDNITPLSDAVRLMEDNHSNLDFIITSGLGHRRIYKDESTIEAVIAFIESGGVAAGSGIASLHHWNK